MNRLMIRTGFSLRRCNSSALKKVGHGVFPYSTIPPIKKSRHSSKLAFGAGMIALGTIVAAVALNSVEKEPSDFLNPEEFRPFVITQRVDLDEDHYLVEVEPRFKKWKKDKSTKIWDSSRMWSVEVMQPEIMVVRRYTPLPLKLSGGTIGVRDVPAGHDEDDDNGKLVFYIKKYKQGEVARWIYRKPIGSELMLRGPFIEASVPMSSELYFYGGGTGIVPIVQSLLSIQKGKEAAGFTNLHIIYSTKTEKETFIPAILKGVIGANVELVHLVGAQRRLMSSDLPPGGPRYAMICGPDGYIAYLAGMKAAAAGMGSSSGQGQLGGLLLGRGWTADRVLKM